MLHRIIQIERGEILKGKAFAYIRTTDMYQTDDVKRQVNEIEAYCHDSGISNIEYFIYYGAGGNLFQNAEFVRLKESISQSAKDHAVFVVHSIDRLTRNLREWQEVLSDMNRMGLTCCVVKSEYSLYDLGLQQDLAEITNYINPEYTDSCDGVDESIPKLLILKPISEGRTAMIMSDGNEYYLVNDEMSEMMALEFHADKCRVSKNGRKIIMDEDDRQFSVADISNFMYPLEVNDDSGR